VCSGSYKRMYTDHGTFTSKWARIFKLVIDRMFACATIAGTVPAHSPRTVLIWSNDAPTSMLKCFSCNRIRQERSERDHFGVPLVPIGSDGVSHLRVSPTHLGGKWPAPGESRR
jgi:hypothetical protein